VVGVRHRMASAGPRLGGQLEVQVDEGGTGNVPRLVQLAAGRPAEPPPGVANQPSLTASSRDATQACSPSTSRQVARTSAAAPGAVYTCRARGSPPSSATPPRRTAAGAAGAT